MDLPNLRQRLEYNVLDKFDGNKRLAILYLRPLCSFYARKADSKYGTKWHSYWCAVYKAYSGAEFALSYWLGLDEDFEREMAEKQRGKPTALPAGNGV